MPHRLLRFRLLAWPLLLSGYLGLGLWVACRPTPESRQSSVASDMQSCQGCHERIYQNFLETGMGRSMYLPAQAPVIEQFDSIAPVHDAFQDLYYLPLRRGTEMYIREFRLKGTDTTHVREELVSHVIGSGNQTRSYFIQKSGYLYEAPITWYVERQLWDLSPGYEQGNNSRFGREIGTACLHCHTGSYALQAGSKNNYASLHLGITCARCHGDGTEHAHRMQQAPSRGDDMAIVNPEDLSTEAQFDICQQCHLQGINVLKEGKTLADFQPGMRLREVYEVFTVREAHQDSFGIASHAARLQQSACFLQSEGKLSCTTCHDPHKRVDRASPLVYVAQCQQCHGAQGGTRCGAPAAVQMSEQGKCVSCHMPKGGTSDIPHVSFHDHFIRVLEQDEEAAQPQGEAVNVQKAFLKLACATNPQASDSDWGKAWLAYFEEVEADPAFLQLALEKLQPENAYERASVYHYLGDPLRALPLIEQALEQRPMEALVAFRKGEILESLGRYAEAWQVYQALYERTPLNLEAGLKATANLLKARQGEQQALLEARQQLRQLYQQKPFDVRILTNLGFVCLNLRDFPQAETYLQQALALHPDHLQARENLQLLQQLKKN